MINRSFLDAAVTLDHVSIHHQIEFRPIEARQFALKSDPHPQPGYQLRDLIREIDKFIPPMNYGLINGHQNQNHGKPHHWYTVGKEYSRVLYLHIAKHYLDNSHPYSYRPAFNWEEFKSQLTALAGKYGADEYWVEKETGTGFTARFWWD